MTKELNPIGQLRWRCRRGTKELDRMLSGYLEEDYAHAASDLQKAFEVLLDAQDPDIYDWLMGVTSPDNTALQAIVTELCDKYGTHGFSTQSAD